MKKLVLIPLMCVIWCLVGCSQIQPAQKQQMELTVDPILLQAVPEMIVIQTTNPCSVIPTTETLQSDK